MIRASAASRVRVAFATRRTAAAWIAASGVAVSQARFCNSRHFTKGTPPSFDPSTTSAPGALRTKVSPSADVPQPPPMSGGRPAVTRTRADGSIPGSFTPPPEQESTTGVGNEYSEANADSQTARESAARMGATATFGLPGDDSEIGGHVGPDGKYDPWAVMGLKPGASMHDIRTRYHELLKEYHPGYVTDGSGGDVHKFNEIDRAFQLLTRAPTLDKRYRNLVSDTQYFYYRFLPQWMAKNVDEMPRWWSWLRWKTNDMYFVFMVCVACFAIARIGQKYPFFAIVIAVSFASDCLLHTMLTPPAFAVMMMKAIMSKQTYTLSWLTSPKGFLRKPLEY